MIFFYFWWYLRVIFLWHVHVRQRAHFLLKNVRNRSQYSVGQYAMTWSLIEKAAKPKETRPKEIKKSQKLQGSYDKTLFDWVRSGRMRKYLSRVHDTRTSLRLVCASWKNEPNTCPCGPPILSISTYSWLSSQFKYYEDTLRKCLMHCKTVPSQLCSWM